VGFLLGAEVGAGLGCLVGDALGKLVEGRKLGVEDHVLDVGVEDGLFVGDELGSIVGDELGLFIGAAVASRITAW
jgi:hypothetical protein